MTRGSSSLSFFVRTFRASRPGGFVRKHRGHFCNLSLPRERVWWLFKISGSIHRGTRRSSRSGWAAALGCSGRTTLLEALPPDSLPRSWELLPALSSRVGITAARPPPGTQPRREQRPSEGSRRVRFPGGGEGGCCPPSRLLPPPASSASSILSERPGGRPRQLHRASPSCRVRVWSEAGSLAERRGVPEALAVS